MGGALMKGHLHNNNGGRGRSIGLLFLVAFGIAIFGVILVHNLRERRMVNLVVKEKDHQLISLQLLLQKERENVKEAKSKMESMKAKMHTLRNQNMEMSSRLLEMQSTISSLKDDQRAIEIALEEKRIEIDQLRERSEESNNENIHAKTLSEMLKQKEAEIEELKRYRGLPLEALSVSSDDSSVNETSNATENVEVLKSDAGLLIETAVDSDAISANNQDGHVLALGGDGRSSEEIISSSSSSNRTIEEGSIERKEGVKEKSIQHEEGVNEKSSSNEETDKMAGEKKTEYGSTETSEKIEEHEDHATISQSGSEEDDDHRPVVHFVGGKKLEMPKNLHGVGYTFRGKHSNTSRLKGHRLGLTSKAKEISRNSMMDTSTTNEGLKMKKSGRGESEKGNGDTKVGDDKADDDKENKGDSAVDNTNFMHSMPEHAEEIMPKAGNADKHRNATITSNSTYEQSLRGISIIHNYRDRGTFNNTSMHNLNDSKRQTEDSEIKDVQEAEVDTSKQSDSEFEEKGEDE
ncbi:hypothetical protein Leryth_019834 [Lithospermum erythrorhizon]|nr:hypothetical protein Leryth_019834 [Lithospermum erythrorhizon]